VSARIRAGSRFNWFLCFILIDVRCLCVPRLVLVLRAEDHSFCPLRFIYAINRSINLALKIIPLLYCSLNMRTDAFVFLLCQSLYQHTGFCTRLSQIIIKFLSMWEQLIQIIPVVCVSDVLYSITRSNSRQFGALFAARVVWATLQARSAVKLDKCSLFHFLLANRQGCPDVRGVKARSSIL
jgi:hypothetical protein